MTATSTRTFDAADLSAKARDHLWMHFTRLSSYANSPVPTIVRGDGAYVYDVHGKRYLDGLAGLFVVQAGHGRRELADAAARQAEQAQGDQPVHRVPRHHARRAVDHRDPGRQGDVRTTRAGHVQGAEHEL